MVLLTCWALPVSPFPEKAFPPSGSTRGASLCWWQYLFSSSFHFNPFRKSRGCFFVYLLIFSACLFAFKVNHHWQNKWISNGLLQLPVLPVLCLFSKHSNISVYEGLCFWCISIIPFCQAKFYQKHLDLAAITIVIIRT